MRPTMPTMPTIPPAQPPPHRGRRHELDWLRTAAVLGLIPFHAAVVFTVGSGDYIKNAETSRALDYFVNFFSFWGMPLIFLVAGAASYLALERRTPRRYLRERALRLLVPFLFGMVAIVPIQVYIGLLASPGEHPSFPAFYGQFLLSLARIFTGVFPQNGDKWIGHLWFIPLLLGFAVLTLPAVFFLRSRTGLRLIAWMAARCGHPAVLLLLALPCGLLETVMRSGVTDALSVNMGALNNWALFAIYLMYFMGGYVLYSDPRFAAAFRRLGVAMLLPAATLWMLYFFITYGHNAPSPDVSIGFLLFSLLRSCISWFWVVAIVGCSMRFLTFTVPALEYLDTAAYPAYVLHMPILTLIAFFVVQWDLPLVAKLLLLVLATGCVTLGIYDAAVKRSHALRFLLGLKPPSPKEPDRSNLPKPESPGGSGDSGMASLGMATLPLASNSAADHSSSRCLALWIPTPTAPRTKPAPNPAMHPRAKRIVGERGS